MTSIQPKILLVDDEEAIQKILKSVLEKEGFEVLTANNGRTALNMVGLEDFVAVISDINMPGSDGVELLKGIRSTNSQLPVILMTGFTNIIEAKAAFEIGANGFLAKPFRRDELMSVLTQAREAKAPQEVVISEPLQDFCRIGIDQFISGKTIKFEIFIRLSEGKYLKVAHTGEDIDLARIRAYKSKGVDFLYIRKHDFAEYVGFSLNLSRAVKNNQAISREKKIEIAKHTNAVILENVFVNGINRESFDHAKEITENTVSLLSESPESFDILASLRATGDTLYAHSLGVSLYSTILAKRVGWNMPTTIFKISLAGLFHDVGLKEIDRDVVEKKVTDLTVEEVKRLETHSAGSARILGSIPSISSEILQAVLQHHESGDGRGYPSRLTKNKIIPMARLISVADEFCDLALASPNSPGISAIEAVERLSLLRTNSLDTQFLNALKSVFGIENMATPSRKA
jgi:response regulator RpfG family c-di-GMP phosphodiesterase